MTDAHSAYVRSRLRRATRPVAALVLVLALLSLSDALGWTSLWGPDGHSRANAALAIAVAAIGLAAWRPGGSRARRMFVIGCGLFVAALGGATLFGWLSGQTLGIDTLLVSSRVESPLAEVRMAPTTALCLLLAGLVVATLDVKRPRITALATAAASAILFIVALAIIGVLYGVGPDLGAARYTTEMALASAVTLPLLSLALQSVRPELGLVGLATERGPTGILTRWLLLPALVVPVAIGWLVRAADLSNALGDALTAITHVVVFVGLTVLGARAVRRQDRARLAAEQGLRAAHDALEARVLERTADLTRANDDLERAREDAVKAMRARSDFLARMSHEIRTPLNGVLGMIALTNDTDLTDEQRQMLATADASAAQLLGLVEEILDFAKIDAGKLRLEHVPFSLEEALAGAMRGLAHGAHAKGLELLVDLEPTVPDALVGDPKRLQQVIVNLVANAVRFTDVGEVILHVRVADASDDHVELAFRVIDSGIGMAPDTQKIIFEAFTQSEAATTRKYGGTGLGLAICSELTHLMGGTIGVESALGHGSTFTFTARFAAAPQSEAAAAHPSPLAGLSVLVVDEHPASRRILGAMLTACGADPTLVSADGVTAVLESARAAGRTFGLVFVDLARKIPPALFRSVPGAPPVVGVAREPIRKQDADSACQTVIAKPLLPRALHEAASRALSGEAVAVPGARSREVMRAARTLDVLVAEDDATNARVVTLALERLGHRPVLAASGSEAVARLARGGIDLVLMDVQMPGMDGFEATRAIRAGEAERGRHPSGASLPKARAEHLPIVGLTAQALAGDAERCLAAGMDAYLPKPLDRPRLARVIDELAAKYVPPRTLPTGGAPAVPERGTGEAPIARAALVARLGGGDALATEVLAMFHAELPGARAALRRALDAPDQAGVASAAHKLRGALLNIAAGPAARAARTLELAGAVADMTRAPRIDAAARALDEELDRLEVAMGGHAGAGATLRADAPRAPVVGP